MTENKGQMHELPMGWIPVILDDLLTKISNGASVKQHDEKVGFPISRIETIWNETIDLQRVKYVEENSNEFVEKYRLKKGDILFSHINSDLHLGKTAIFILDNLVLIHGINLLLLRPSELISSDFLNYHIKFYRVKGKFIEVAQRAVNQSSINQRKLKSFELFLPPLPEQHKIVAKIEELFSELDNGIENLKKAREQLKIYRQAVLKYAFEGKLTKQWRTLQRRAGNPPEPAEKLLERTRKEREKHYKKQLEDWKKACEQAKKEGGKKPARPKKPKELPPLTEKELAELQELPEGWGWARFQNIVIGSQNGLAKRRSKQGRPYKVLRLADIKKGDINDQNPRKILLTDEEILKYTLFKNDFVCIRVNGSIELVGRMILVRDNNDWAFCDHFIKFNLFQEGINFKYIRLLFDIQTIRRFVNLNMVSSAGQNTVSQSTVSSLPIPFCSSAEQQQIVAEIESRLSVCDKIEQTIEDSLKKAEALRQSILKKAFSGELTRGWREKHPELISGENSAEELLENIKAEKVLAAGRKKPRSKKTKKK